MSKPKRALDDLGKSEMAYVFRKIDELGTQPPKPKPQTPPAQQQPKVIRERPDPPLIHEGTIPEPVSEKPEPKLVGSSTAVKVDGRRPSSPDPVLLAIVKLWPYLTERDRRELVLIARMKAELNQRS